MSRKVNPTFLPWFPFYAAAWVGSSVVRGMTTSERGIYADLMAYNWVNGEIPWDIKSVATLLNIHRKVAERFLNKFGTLSEEVRTGCGTYYLPKLLEFAETLGKSGGAPGQMRGDEINGKKITHTKFGRKAKKAPLEPNSTGENAPFNIEEGDDNEPA